MCMCLTEDVINNLFFLAQATALLKSLSIFASFPLECTGELLPCPSHELGCCSMWGSGDSSRAVMRAQG